MKTSKGQRRFMLTLAGGLMNLLPEVFNVLNIIRDDSRPGEIRQQVEDYNDTHHPGTGGKRWDDLGEKYMKEAEHLEYNLKVQYDLLEEARNNQ